MRNSTPLILLFVQFLASFNSGLCQHRDPLEYIQILESADRVKKLQVNRVIRSLKVQPGQKVADLGAGSGLFTRPLARRVGPEGVVYAVDIDRDLLEYIEETARSQNLENIKTVTAGEYDPRIPEKVDLVLICDTLHHIKNPKVYVQDLVRYLKPDGRVAIIDYSRNWPKRFESARYTTPELDAWMKVGGYTLDEKFDFLEDNFFVIYRYSPDGE